MENINLESGTVGISGLTVGMNGTKTQEFLEVETNSKLTYRKMSAEYNEKLIAFKAKYLLSTGGSAFADWKYQKGPIDCRNCELIALTPDGDIVGHLGAVVFPSVPGCRVPRLALGTEFIVDEKYRGGKHDVIRKLDELLGQSLAKLGTELLYGTPNKFGYLVSKRLYGRADGVKCVYMSRFFTPALWLPRGAIRKFTHRILARGRFKVKAMPKGLSWDSPSVFLPSDIDDFCMEFMQKLDFGALRNAEYLNWRYGGGDGKVYQNIQLIQNEKVIGLAVLMLNPNQCEVGAIMECMALDAGGYDSLIQICAHVASKDAPALKVFGVATSPEIEACMRYGFQMNSKILTEINLNLKWLPVKIRQWLVGKAENHFHVDDYSTLFNYTHPKRSKEDARGRWYLTFGEKSGF